MTKAEVRDDEVLISAGTVVDFDMREIAVLICEGTLNITRPEGFDTEQAYHHIDDLNPQAFMDFTRAARMVLGYIEAQLRAAEAVRQ